MVLSGQLVVSSRLSAGDNGSSDTTSLDVRLLTTRAHREPVATIAAPHATRSLASYILEPGCVRALRLRLHGQTRAVWSQEVNIDTTTAGATQQPRLVKVLQYSIRP